MRGIRLWSLRIWTVTDDQWQAAAEIFRVVRYTVVCFSGSWYTLKRIHAYLSPSRATWIFDGYPLEFPSSPDRIYFLPPVRLYLAITQSADSTFPNKWCSVDRVIQICITITFPRASRKVMEKGKTKGTYILILSCTKQLGHALKHKKSRRKCWTRFLRTKSKKGGKKV